MSCGSMRGAFAASGSPFGFPFSQSNRKMNSYRFSIVWLMLFLLLLALILACPQRRKLLVVPQREQTLSFQAQRGRHRRADLAADLPDLPLIPDRKPAFLGELVQMKLRAPNHAPEYQGWRSAGRCIIALHHTCSDIS